MLRILHLSLAACLAVLAQTDPPPLSDPSASFDVASLKVSQPAPPYPVDLGTVTRGKVTLTNVTLAQCLRFAFNIRNDSQIAGADWIKDSAVLFSIIGKAPANSTKYRTMVLNLLTERFKMAYHHEQRELPYLAITADPKRLALHPARPDEPQSAPEFRPGSIVLNHVSVATLLTLLGQFTSEIFVDQSGLTGFYDIKLQWTPKNLRPADAAVVPGDSPGPTLLDAIEEQLGLKLDRRKGPLDVLVVDRADKTPIEN